MTLDQIEELRAGHERSLSLRQAAANVGLPFEQCPDCKGNGYTKATMLLSTRAIMVLARECPKEPVPIQYERCPRCDGAGGWIKGRGRL
jgi:DnaJ-class molecular chaperone